MGMVEPRMILSRRLNLILRLMILLTLLSLSGALKFKPVTALLQTPDSAIAADLAQPVDLILSGEKQLDAGRYDQAIQSFQQAIQRYQALGEVDNIGRVEVSLAKAYLLRGDYATALPIFQRRVDTVHTQALLGLTYYQLGQYAAAEMILQQTVARWDTLLGGTHNDDRDRITLIDQMAFAYRLLQKVLVAQKKTEAALEISELSRARALVELLAQRYQRSVSQPPTLSQLKQIAKTQNSIFVQYAVVGREMRVLGIEPRDETDVLIWVIQPSGTVTFRQVNLKSANLEPPRTLVQSMRRTVLRRSPSVQDHATHPRSHQTQLQALYNLLIQPIADVLPTDPNALVTFIPEGPLLLVPFAALQDRNNTYLIEKHTIRTAPSIQVLEITRQQQARRPQLPLTPALVVGNPKMPSLPAENGAPPEPLAALPGSEVEARAIAALLKTSALTGAQATQETVIQRMTEASIIHLATHGLLNLDANLNEFGELKFAPPRTARDSGVFIGPGVIMGKNVFIGNVPAELAAARENVVRVEVPGVLALAPSGKNTGFLSAKDILNLRLAAKLAVLSACDTGKGRITGDGIVGLSRALIVAGVPSVIVSLWAVPDTPTAALMIEFYQHLPRMDYAQALRQAMLATLKRYPQPVDWAGFTLIGEARNR
jgi:CHAT domain-containing protein